MSGVRDNVLFPDDVCAISSRYKLRRTAGVESFYDLTLDPDEQTDHIAEPALAAEIQAARAWLDAHLPE